MNNYKILIKVQKATTMCIYVAHWNIFIVNKHDLQKKTKKTQAEASVWQTGRNEMKH